LIFFFFSRILLSPLFSSIFYSRLISFYIHLKMIIVLFSFSKNTKIQVSLIEWFHSPVHPSAIAMFLCLFIAKSYLSTISMLLSAIAKISNRFLKSNLFSIHFKLFFTIIMCVVSVFDATIPTILSIISLLTSLSSNVTLVYFFLKKKIFFY